MWRAWVLTTRVTCGQDLTGSFRRVLAPPLPLGSCRVSPPEELKRKFWIMNREWSRAVSHLGSQALLAFKKKKSKIYKVQYNEPPGFHYKYWYLMVCHVYFSIKGYKYNF